MANSVAFYLYFWLWPRLSPICVLVPLWVIPWDRNLLNSNFCIFLAFLLLLYLLINWWWTKWSLKYILISSSLVTRSNYTLRKRVTYCDSIPNTLNSGLNPCYLKKSKLVSIRSLSIWLWFQEGYLGNYDRYQSVFDKGVQQSLIINVHV